MQRSRFTYGLLRRASAILLAALLPGALLAQDSGSLVVNVISGDGAINNVHRYVPTPTVVVVTNQLDQPVRGASVTFSFPPTGPSGAFADGARSWVGTTDSSGRINLAPFTPNRLEGSYRILVNVTADSRTGTAFIRETNAFSVTPTASRHMGTGAKILIVVGIGAAIAAGSLLALKTGSNASASAAVASTSISLGGITVGAPH